MAPRIVCLLTIHGVGFQQGPDDEHDQPGYADVLHERLSGPLGSLLSDDPNRNDPGNPHPPGKRGPIYVRSHWPPVTSPPGTNEGPAGSIEAGLRRLGTWETRERRAVVHDEVEQRLAGDDRAQIAHVALIYSNLPDLQLDLGALGVTAEMALGSLGHYSSVLNLVKMGVQDIRALLGHPAQAAAPTPSLRVRDEADGGIDPDAVRVVFERLVRDVATYIARNDMRERVRSFVQEALLRLCSRDDVAGIVVNAHSQGSVVAYDVLSQLPPAAAGQVRAFVTLGSPLRKYVTLFFWGREVGCLEGMGPPKTWTNFWDPLDPVADPLVPGPQWRRGDELPQPADAPVLFRALNAENGVLAPFPPRDVQVDNVARSRGGGLQAHNYWDNTGEVIAPLADILRRVVQQVAR